MYHVRGCLFSVGFLITAWAACSGTRDGSDNMLVVVLKNLIASLATGKEWFEMFIELM